MPQFTGSIAIAGRRHIVDVIGKPTGRIVIRVNQKIVFDKTPFVAKERVAFTVEGKTWQLVWRQLSLTKLECDVVAPGSTVTLSERTEEGGTIAPMSPEQRATSMTRMTGMLTAIGGAVVTAVAVGTVLHREPVSLKVLYGGPALLLIGLSAGIAPGKLRRTNRGVATIAAVLMLVLAFVIGQLVLRIAG